jgi:hypothetical protein
MLYNDSLYRGSDLKYWARRCLKHLPREISHLITATSSGCALASGMLLASRRELNHVHWSRERGAFRGAGRYQQGNVYAFVDDLIETGRTYYEVELQMTRHKLGTLRLIIICGNSCLNSAQVKGIRIINAKENP